MRQLCLSKNIILLGAMLENIKIAVFGNTHNNWSSITEIEIDGSNKVLTV